MKTYATLGETMEATSEGGLAYLTIEHDGEELFVVFPDDEQPIVRYVSADPGWQENVFVQVV